MKNKILLTIGLFLTLIILANLFSNYVSELDNDVWYEDFGKHSILRIRDEVYRDIDINTLYFDMANTGDYIEINSPLPSLAEDAYLAFRVWHSTVDMYI